MTPQNTEQERKLFEAFASDNGNWLKAIERDARGNYLLLTTAVGWMWWQAARRAPATPVHVSSDDFDEDVEDAEDAEDSECASCSGTGEGMYDSQSCVVCLGKGFL